MTVRTRGSSWSIADSVNPTTQKPHGLCAMLLVCKNKKSCLNRIAFVLDRFFFHSSMELILVRPPEKVLVLLLLAGLPGLSLRGAISVRSAVHLSFFILSLT